MDHIKNVRCEHMYRPLAVTVEKPRFSWEWSTEENNVFQSAYQIIVQKEDGAIVWNSAKITGRNTTDIEYAGQPLDSKCRYLYQITAWDQKGKEVKSGQEYFETAFLRSEEWRAEWIEPVPLPQLRDNPLEEAKKTWMAILGAMMRGENPEIISDEANMRAQPLEPYDPPVRMRKVFRLEKQVARARLYITAHGIYEAKINGRPVTDSVLNPGFTTYDKRLKYQVFPVEALLQCGENAIAVTVADGWYKGKIALGRGCEYGEVPGLLVQLEMVYEDGTRSILCSDESWCYSFDGPVRMADLFLGQTVDARLDDGEPSLCTYDASAWKGVRQKQESGQAADAQCSPLAKVFAEIPARRVWTAPNGDTLIDFGQNLAGVIRAEIRGQTGEEVTFEHGEMLDQNGNFTYAFEGDETRAQKDCYVCAGSGREVFLPQFTYHGFRYVRVKGGRNWTKEQFTALAVSTENPQTGDFLCSDERLNQLQHNIYWSQRSNNITIPTDCPTREKAGWTGDVVVYGATALYNQDMTAFYEDWLKSVRLEQTKEGHVLNTVPLIKNYIQQTMAGSLGWGDVILTLPLQLHHLKGDIRVLEENYQAMENWVEAMRKSAYELPTTNPMGAMTAEQFAAMSDRQQDNQHYLINTGFHFGDWLVPSVKNAEGFSDGPASSFLTMNYVDTALLAADADMFAEVSVLLGYPEKAKEYQIYAGRVREAFYEEYVGEDGRIRQEMQGNYILALKYHMVPEEMEPVLAGHLNELIRKNNFCLDTGFMSVPYLLDVLCDYGYEETAWKILWQTKCPSWLYEIEHDATTVWENWDAVKEDGTVDKCSFNHYAFGCVGDFMYRRIAGIQNVGNAYDKIRIAPLYGCGLAWVEGKYKSPAGLIQVRWEKNKEQRISISGRIPANTEAVLVLPDGSEQKIGNGCFAVEV